jgi:hypothetical protein
MAIAQLPAAAEAAVAVAAAATMWRQAGLARAPTGAGMVSSTASTLLVSCLCQVTVQASCQSLLQGRDDFNPLKKWEHLLSRWCTTTTFAAMA